MTISQAMVLAAGLGTRMRPITDTLPKPLVKVAGKTLVDYALDHLSQAGVETAVVNIHHFPEMMLAHLAQRPAPRILISDERDGLMNNGGGLAKGIKLLQPGPLLVMNADLFWIGEPKGQPTNLQRLGAAFDPAAMDMIMLCVRLEQTTGHNGKNDFNLGTDGRLTRYKSDDPNPVVYAGALAMDRALLDDAPQDAFNLNIYFDTAITKGRLFGLMLEGEWLTVGTPEAIGEAEAVLARLPQGA
ncbi:nucleotidyltransferase family protein [Allorhizobium taibaishanense]|uniref:Mannose-1-phosphate guanylyltransferase n=1 Tax=Allorhizobium taibaishanense TaxID=887144 RepID=A0A1Q9A2H4_9HYPH|nr:nucleotidyltransferase family protein [Allorhizobium taibaishanense]MBB4008961.1 MurNAc alpha-1-phosphate uridylyltransferase [Allorhizobium taibaishanense]OLP48719.1 mannose-1-phosphate guanylyltransferase [Allorhizobium taibaishanense]